jgi:U32 family peptidase
MLLFTNEVWSNVTGSTSLEQKRYNSIDLRASGVRHFRIELLTETQDEIGRTIELYRELLAGRITGRQVWRRLRAAHRLGVTRGTLEERRNPLAIL